jgi:hypothetical protein
MDTEDRAPCRDTPIPLPDHLLPSLQGAAEQDLEWACDGVWDDERREHVRNAVHVMDALAARTWTPQQLARIASSAILWEEPRAGTWPTTREGVDELVERLERVRQLIQLRDRAHAQSEHGPTLAR